VADGLLAGNPRQLSIQAVAVLGALAYSAAATFVVLKLVALVVPLRVDAKDEGLGMDVSQHGEEAYARGQGAILLPPEALTFAPLPQPRPVAAEGGAA
jgi:Amt family ammonium transporter